MLCASLRLLLFLLTFDGDVSKQALFLLAASSLSFAHVVSLVLQPYGLHGEVQDPAVGVRLEGRLGQQGLSVVVHAATVQPLGLALLVLQSLGVKAKPLQLVVGVVVGAAGQRHFVLLQGILRGTNIHAETFRNGFKVETQEAVRGLQYAFMERIAFKAKPSELQQYIRRAYKRFSSGP